MRIIALVVLVGLVDSVHILRVTILLSRTLQERVLPQLVIVSLIPRLCPFGSAVSITVVMMKEAAHASWSKVGRTKSLFPRHHHRIGEENSASADSSLQVTEHKLPTTYVIRVVG